MPDSTVTISGNLTRDPELTYTRSGTARSYFGVAVNRRWKNRQTDEWEEQVSFLNVVAWGDLAEHVSESLSKGARVMVSGRIEQRSWEGDDGQKRSTVEIVADDIGASLRWATATVERTTRSDRSSSGRAPAAASAAPAASQYADLDGDPF